MKKGLFALVLVFAVCVFGCEKKPDVVIPEEVRGKWYVVIPERDKGKLLCEIFSDRITFYDFTEHRDDKFLKARYEYFINKSFYPIFLENEEFKKTLSFKLKKYPLVKLLNKSANYKDTEVFMRIEYRTYSERLDIDVYSIGAVHINNIIASCTRQNE